MKTISITNNKGGVGKTTTTINLGYEFSQNFNKRVLLVDLDTQANMSRFFSADDTKPNIAHTLLGVAKINDAIQHTQYKKLDIIPASEELKAAWEQLDVPGGNLELRNILQEVSCDYDICLLDNAPALGINTDNAFAASDEVIVPIGIDTYGFWGLDKIMRDIEKARQVNPSLYFTGCLVTRYVDDEISREVTRQMKEQEVYPVFETQIRESKIMRRASFTGQPIVENSLLAGAAIDYRIFAKKYIENNLCS